MLLEISTIIVIEKNQIEKVANREFLVDVVHRRRQVVSTQKQSDWDRLACQSHLQRKVFQRWLVGCLAGILSIYRAANVTLLLLPLRECLKNYPFWNTI